MAKAACEARCAALFRLCATQASDSGCGACIVEYAGASSGKTACVREEASGSSKSSGGGAGTSSSIAVEVTLGLGCGVLFFFLVVSMARRGWFTWCTRLRRTQQYRGYFQSTSPRWQCSVCLHDNSAVHKQCVLCASDSPGVHREHMLKQSMQLFLTAPSTTLRRHLRVDFMEEPGVDGGGILREWLHLVCSSLFSDALGVFEPANSSIHQGYWINRNAALRCRSHLQVLSFAGKLLGKALLEGMIINVQLSIPLLKHLLGVPFSLTDLRNVDEQIYSSLVYLLKNDEVEQLGLTFAVAGHELIPDGANVAVTDVNKQRYVDRLVKYYLFDSVERELKCFTEGVRSVIPGNILHVFDYRELDLLISGLAEIDVVDWKEHTDVRLLDQDLGRELQIIEWFWDIIGAMSQIERSRLLQYVTGCGGLPVEGFAGLTGLDGLLQPFTIQLTDTASNSYTMLPYASTCVNRLDIPMYSSRDEMEEMLHMVIQMDVTGFNRQ
ncbi:hypothetical protein Poli38472_000725 [Pythium oligandrum]|uniref:HECT-type E3 ubiquitin transferase n=1 Tax=Pythium oligandrum TaxID=41045 RepID=A0A8K1CDN3_PYTOL|nr:hypothetical protein Poli38472_000725 [Pythium oligandrum]|eukprot:TMW60683.1 hypothetical protein Poli38472_000725 [Pythium oligandrum]